MCRNFPFIEIVSTPPHETVNLFRFPKSLPQTSPTYSTTLTAHNIPITFLFSLTNKKVVLYPWISLIFFYLWKVTSKSILRMETYLFWIVPIASLLALVLAWYFYRQMMRESEGTPTFLLRTFRLFGNENGNVCFSAYRQCSPQFFEQRLACRIPKRSGHGTGCSRTRLIWHFILVSIAG